MCSAATHRDCKLLTPCGAICINEAVIQRTNPQGITTCANKLAVLLLQKAKTVTSRNGVRVTQILQTDVELTATEVAMAAATVAQGKVRNMVSVTLQDHAECNLHRLINTTVTVF